MNIIGLDYLHFESDRTDACASFLVDFGLREIASAHPWRAFETTDGTGIALNLGARSRAAPNGLCEIVYGVEDQATLDSIAGELSRDRDVWFRHGAVHAIDDAGFAVGFQITRRSPRARTHKVRTAAADSPRATAGLRIRPQSLSSIQLFVPDMHVAERFYVERLGFKVTDRISGAGAFLTPEGSQEHHTLCLMQTPTRSQGMDQFTFHLASGTDVMRAGAGFERRGYRTSWGPGRHLLGSNWFWYFDSPFGCKIAYDAELEQRTERLEVRETTMTPDRPEFTMFAAPDCWVPRVALH
jgi:catechol 2,3-dioxygenase-like lactoylglutathione lyase family enzyme